MSYAKTAVSAVALFAAAATSAAARDNVQVAGSSTVLLTLQLLPRLLARTLNSRHQLLNQVGQALAARNFAKALAKTPSTLRTRLQKSNNQTSTSAPQTA